jgi:hypothetical protein
MHFISDKLILISLFLLLISTIETLAYATRLSGVRVGLIASALSLFNTIVLVSRFSTMFQQPLTGKLIKEAPHHDKLHFIAEQYRVLIGTSTIGTLVGILLLPTFIALFSRAIIQLSAEKGSIVNLTKKWGNARGLKRVVGYFRFPRVHYLKGLKLRLFPRRLFVFNVLITAIYTVGVLSSLYASVLSPENAAAAIMSSGIINGVATILLALFVDPKASVLADSVAKKQISYVYLKNYSVAMVGSKLLGTLLAQLLFIPAAYYIVWFSSHI